MLQPDYPKFIIQTMNTLSIHNWLTDFISITEQMILVSAILCVNPTMAPRSHGNNKDISEMLLWSKPVAPKLHIALALSFFGSSLYAIFNVLHAKQ